MISTRRRAGRPMPSGLRSMKPTPSTPRGTRPAPRDSGAYLLQAHFRSTGPARTGGSSWPTPGGLVHGSIPRSVAMSVVNRRSSRKVRPGISVDSRGARCQRFAPFIDEKCTVFRIAKRPSRSSRQWLRRVSAQRSVNAPRGTWKSDGRRCSSLVNRLPPSLPTPATRAATWRRRLGVVVRTGGRGGTRRWRCTEYLPSPDQSRS